MSFWGELKRRNVFKVAVAYLVLMWLLILAVTIVFPFLDLPRNATTFVIALLITGFPVALVFGWAYEITPDGIRHEQDPTETTIIRNPSAFKAGVLVLAILGALYLAVDRFLLTEDFEDESVGQVTDTIRIGVLSPKEGSRAESTGIAHENVVRLAFERLGPIQVGATEFNVEVVGANDLGDPDTSVTHALRLTHDEEIAALLGPVNSNATAAVLEALREDEVVIPVVSSLSTAPSLTAFGQRDPNFFRHIADDGFRMRELANHINENSGVMSEQVFLILFEEDAYGEGLKDSIDDVLATTNIEIEAWCNVIENPEARCRNGTFDPEFYEELRTGTPFTQEFMTLLAERGVNRLLLLGTNDASLKLATGIEQATGNTQYQFYFVGHSQILFDEAPLGSLTIANPILDPNNAPTPALRVLWDELLTDFDASSDSSRLDFILTTYEAASVVHQALSRVLRDQGRIPPIDELRRQLRNELEDGTFEAIEPWRTVEYSQGALSRPPAAPILEIQQAPRQVVSSNSQPWVDLEVAPRFNYLESPIRVGLTANDVDFAEVRLYREEAQTSRLIRERVVQFTAGAAELDLHVFRPGSYRISVANHSAFAETRIVFSRAYFLSIIAAFVGAWIIVSREQIPLRSRINRIGLGIFAGFVLTFSSLYGNEIAGWFPFPSFGDEPVINALITGLLGGLLGPYVLAEAFVNWVTVLSVRLDGKPASD